MKKKVKILEKINRRARQIVRESPQISYRDAQKQAGLERREGLSGRKKAKRAAPAKKTVGARYRVTHHVEKIGASQINQTRKQLEAELKAQRAWMLLAKDSAANAKARAKAQADLMRNKRELKAITGYRPARKKKRK